MRVLLLTVFAVAAAAAFAAPPAIEREHGEIELKRAIGALAAGDERGALKALGAVIQAHPNFRLAQMAYADLLAVRAQQPPLLSAPTAAERVRIKDLLDEARSRIGYQPGYANKLPGSVARLSRYHRHALVFDAARSRLYLFENRDGRPQLVADYYASSGRGGLGKQDEGDARTPLGVYKITRYLGDDELPELYGAGALPLDYPNPRDRAHNHDGHGIWLHGVPRLTYSRPPLASRGCIVVSNTALESLQRRAQWRSTPVILVRNVSWLDEPQWLDEQQALLDAVRQWQDDWQSLDVEKYLAHYSRGYRSATQNYRQMAAQVRRNARRKTFVTVSVKHLDLLRYSDSSELAVVRFDQDYRSNNYNVAYRKQQFWKRENGTWKIEFEGRD